MDNTNNPQEPKPKRLRAKQRKFVKLVARTGDHTQAYLGAGYTGTTPEVIKASASRIMRQPEVQNALEAELEKIYPSFKVDSASLLQQILQNALSSSDAREKRETMKLVLAFKGWEAPRKSRVEKLTADVSDRFKPPKE